MRQLLIILVLIGTTVTLLAQGNSFVTWTVADGLPQSQVYAICQDSEGYIWVGTQGGGVARFDGKSFEKVSIQHGLPSDYINAICSDSAGQIWVGTSSGLATARVGKADRVAVPFTANITCLLADTDLLYVGTTRGLYVLDKKAKHFRPVKLSNESCVSLTSNGDSKIFVATTHSVFCLQKQQDKMEKVYAVPKEKVDRITSLIHLDGFLYFGLNTGLVSRISTAKEKWFIEEIGKGGEMALLAQGTSGSLLVGSRNVGIKELTIGKSALPERTWSELNGLPRNDIRALFADSQRNVWVGTSGGGLSLMTHAQFQSWTTKNGLPDQRIYALCLDESEQLFVTAGRKGILKLEAQGHFSQLKRTEILNGLKCRTLAVDYTNRIWVGTEGAGLFVFTDSMQEQKLHVGSGHLPSDLVQKILCQPNGSVLIATTKGVVELGYVANQWSVLNRYEDGLHVTTLARDSTNGIWFGTADGRVGLLGDNTKQFPSYSGLPTAMVTSVVVGANRNLYVSTKTHGIFMLDMAKTAKFQPLPDSLSPSSRTVYLLASDAQGRLWAGTEAGVYCIETYAERKWVKYFGVAQGFTGLETCQDAAICDGNGQMLFGTMNGLMQQLPIQRQTLISSKPYLHFERISLFYKQLAQTEFASQEDFLFDTSGNGMTLPHYQNHLRFDFKGFNPASTEPVLYRYRLFPHDLDWSPWDKERSVQFASLVPGTYTLVVQARHSDHSDIEVVKARFSITAPWWNTLMFKLLVGFVLIVLLSALIHWYIRSVKQVEQKKRAQLELQNRMLALEQKAMQLQMNPHFIFNALNSIQSFIASQNQEKARQEMMQFARLMRSVLQNSRKQSISLQEEMELLTNYLSIEQNLRPYGFDFEVISEKNLSTEELQIPPMLIQPFVENAIIHGVAQLSKRGFIGVRFRLVGNSLFCEVIDNGIGREKAKVLAVNKLPGYQSTALEVTSDRLAILGGSVEIGDVLDSEEMVVGTQVLINLPVEFD